MTLSKRLTQIRNEAGLTKAELSRKMDVHESYITLIEQGVRNPTLAVIKRWAKACGGYAVLNINGIVVK